MSLLFQVQHPTIDVKGEIKRIVMEGADLVGLEMTQKIRDSIQNGVVLQDMKNMGLGDLWSPRESPDGPEEPQYQDVFRFNSFILCRPGGGSGQIGAFKIRSPPLYFVRVLSVNWEGLASMGSMSRGSTWR